jgi:SAM-dependent methyltransferase
MPSDQGWRMDRYGPETYGERIADVYDAWHAGMDPAAAVEVLASLAGSGPVLELGIGTGRVAIPLAERGLEVHGIDASPAMVEQMRAKPGGGAIGVTFGHLADVAVDRSFSLIFIAFNTFFVLLTQDDQVRCFANVAKRLEPGGCFSLEGFVPDVARFDRGQRVHVLSLDIDLVRLDVSLHRPVEQRVDAQHVVLTGDGGTPRPRGAPLRLAVGARPHGATGRAPAAPSVGRLEPRVLRR